MVNVMLSILLGQPLPDSALNCNCSTSKLIRTPLILFKRLIDMFLKIVSNMLNILLLPM